MNAILPPSHFSRRGVLLSGGALVIGVVLPLGSALRAQGAPKMPPVDPNAFIRIAPDSTVTVIIKHIEFGQGPNTGLSTLVAEELDADWSQMRAESAPGKPVYANLFMGAQLTGGSTAIANSYIQMRTAGAMARYLLVAAAARKWGVPPAQVTVTKGVIAHKASGKTGTFGEFAADAATLTPPADVPLKDAKAFTLIGKTGHIGKPDTLGKTNGTAKFGMDVDEPGMLTALVQRSPRFGGKVASFDAAAAMKVKGVVAVKQVPTGVAVYAHGMWAASLGRKALKVTWDDSGAETRGSAEMLAQYRATAKTPGKSAGKKGDVAAALADGKLIEAEYAFPYLAHAPMEPLSGYIEWDGTAAKARFGSQGPGLDVGAMAGALGIPPEKVSIAVMLAGGSFGRRATADAHFAAELAAVAKAFGPGVKVKLVWTREDDIHGGYYRPMMVHRFQGAIKDGKVTAWSNTVCGQSFAMGTAFESMMVKDGIDSTMVEGAAELPYGVPAFACSAHIDRSVVPTLWWRSVGHTHTGYAVECFIDQLLVAAGQDPVAGRLALIEKPRFAGVLKAVAELANWTGSKAPKGRARGVAVVESFNTFVAQIAEVSMGEDGIPKVHKVWCAVDCGVAVNPDVIRAQMEGGIGFALGHALFAEVPLIAGAPTVSNFNNYRALRINEMPEVEVVIIASAEAPTGVGEPGVPPLAPAVANALAALGQARPALLPMVKHA
ncbi:xanthine dehydrogenase family protein molybdopterin-binding subunit [soil metagenome]